MIDMMRINAVELVGITVAEMERSIHFYTTILLYYAAKKFLIIKFQVLK
jgi:hypothetical protein